ncbi:MAG: DNA polymerase III subunit beta [Halobacteriovoraceae bacterium]|jgi:DNA polymerase III subunit beta|nr:DNA polymerase III subunit beta [Halobacteriovoraceae bacterium]MBT5096135.1 DNA polymerase III subunit beta [Halobacteriovoraceae bacterium]
MRFKVQTEPFRDALNKILSVVDKRNSRPILTYTQIDVSEGKVEISATDLEVSSRIKVAADVETAGTFCVNAKNISDILKGLPEGTVNFEIAEGENTLKISCLDIHYTLLIYKSDDFPHLIFDNKENSFALDSVQLLEIIGKTSHAISTDETRLYLNGIYLQEFDSKLRAVATDGHRLSMLDTDLGENNIETLMNGIIIPKKGVFEIKKVAESFPDKKLNISVDDSFIYISADDSYYLSIRLIAREYPKYQAVIPSKTSFVMKTDKTIFHDAIRRIKIMSNEKSNGVKVSLKGNEMTVMANHPSLGDARETLSVDYNGKEIEIGFNAKYLIDTLAAFDDGDITLELNNELSPVVIKSQNLPNYLGIIMPLKL